MDAPVETLAELDGGVWDEVLGPLGPDSGEYPGQGCRGSSQGCSQQKMFGAGYPGGSEAQPIPPLDPETPASPGVFPGESLKNSEGSRTLPSYLCWV